MAGILALSGLALSGRMGRPSTVARNKPSLRSQARANFEKEEMLAREKKAKTGQPLVLGSRERGSDTATERVIDARAFGPALRGVRKRKRSAAERRTYGD
jgi:hypothetical protein